VAGKNEWEAVLNLRSELLKNPLEIQEIEGEFSVAAHALLSALESNDRKKLSNGYKALRRTYTMLSAYSEEEVEEQCPFFMGRIVGMMDVLSGSLQRIKPGDYESVLKQDKNKAILLVLQKEEMRSKDIASQLNKDEGQISRDLSELEQARMIVRVRMGRELYSRLSFVGRQVMEQVEEEEVQMAAKKSGKKTGDSKHLGRSAWIDSEKIEKVMESFNNGHYNAASGS